MDPEQVEMNYENDTIQEGDDAQSTSDGQRENNWEDLHVPAGTAVVLLKLLGRNFRKD